MDIGDKSTELVHFGDCQPIRRTGRVVYIHRDHRFYIVEFEFDKGKFCESYLCPGHGRTEADDRERPLGGNPGL